MSDKIYDVAIIGGGPNGLICGAYLARTGLSVVILESRHETGGGLDTLEFAGFRYNPHAVYHMMADYMPAYRDLSLKERGVRYIYPDVQAAYINPAMNPILFYRDPESTARYLAANFSPADGDAYRTMYADFREFSEKILMPLTYVPPVPFIEQTQILNNAADGVGKRYNEIAEMTPIDMIDSYGFSDPVTAALLNFFLMWGMSPYEVGFIFPLYVYRMTSAALVAGGSHRLSSAIYRAFCEAGGEVMDRAEVARVVTTNGRASGVVTRDGVEVRAKVVVSTADPRQNFLDFFEEGDIPGDLAESARNWQWEKESFFGAHVALAGPPVYTGTESAPDANRAMIAYLGIDGVDALLDHVEELTAGRLPTRLMGHATVASLFDPLMACPGCHSGRWESLVPYDADWDAIKHDYGRLCVEEWKRYAPNLDPLNVMVYPPTYIAQKNRSMVRGSIKHGAYVSIQMGYLRPNDRCSRGSTPI
ncbi:MAG: NAD(P)/FAD-dependent oxidoreductase, partial [Methanoregulaceae archaeon]|nr:NAD(P)/FAD-dependent oxidoreductase [Methanoregulaceae archaeon]